MSQDEEKNENPFNLEQVTKRFQLDYIQNVLESTNWDIEAAANLLGISLDDLKQKMVLLRK